MAFLLAFLATAFATVFFPQLRLATFAPFLALTYYKRSFPAALWIGALSGLALDLISSQTRLGWHAFNFCITTAFLYPQRRHFIQDKPIALSLYTSAIAAVSSALELVLMSVRHGAFDLTARLVLTDLFAMSLVDGLYAFVWFTLPLKGYAYVKKVGVKELYFRLIRWLKFFYKRADEAH